MTNKNIGGEGGGVPPIAWATTVTLNSEAVKVDF